MDCGRAFSTARRRIVGVAMAFWLATSLALAADPLTVIPDDALGLAVINNLADTSSRIQKLTEKMQLPVPELLPMAQLYTGAQQGLDDKGSLAAALFPAEDETSTWSSMGAVFVPVSDYKAFVGQLMPEDADAEICTVTIFGMQLLCTQKGDFAVLATSDAKPLVEKIKASTKSVAQALAPMQPWIAQQQLAVVATPEGKKKLVQAFSGFMDTAVEGIQQVQAADKDNGDEQTERVAQSLESATETMKIAKEMAALVDEQVTQLGIGIRIDDTTAFHLDARLMFLPNGGLSKWAASVKRPEGGLLLGLPAGRFTLAYGGAAIQSADAITKLYDRMTQSGMMVLGLDKENQQKLSDVLNKYRQNQISTAALMGRPRPGDSIMSTTMQVEHVKDAARQFELARELFTVFSKVRFPGAADDRPAYAIADVDVGDLKTIEVTMDMGAMMANQGDAAPAVGNFMQMIFGNEGVMKSYITVGTDKTLVMAYSKEQVKYAVEHVRSKKSGLETDESIANTAKLLPGDPQWAAYISPQGAVSWADTILKQIPDLKINLPPFPDSDPIGLAAKVTGEGLDADLVLPESVVAGIGQYIGVVQQMLMGGDAPLP